MANGATIITPSTPSAATHVSSPTSSPRPPKTSATIARTVSAGECPSSARRCRSPRKPGPPNQPNIFCVPWPRNTQGKDDTRDRQGQVIRRLEQHPCGHVCASKANFMRGPVIGGQSVAPWPAACPAEAATSGVSRRIRDLGVGGTVQLPVHTDTPLKRVCLRFHGAKNKRFCGFALTVLLAGVSGSAQVAPVPGRANAHRRRGCGTRLRTGGVRSRSRCARPTGLTTMGRVGAPITRASRCRATRAFSSGGRLIFGYNAVTESESIVRVHKAGGVTVTAPADAVPDLSSPIERERRSIPTSDRNTSPSRRCGRARHWNSASW